MQLVIKSSSFHQFIVRADLFYFSLIQYHYFICFTDGAKTVGDNNGSSPAINFSITCWLVVHSAYPQMRWPHQYQDRRIVQQAHKDSSWRCPKESVAPLSITL
jgi:hypothetical protein